MNVNELLDDLIERYPMLKRIKGDIKEAYSILKICYEKGGKVLVCGNGGSASDSEHIVGELMKGFLKQRKLTEEEREVFERQGEEYTHLTNYLQGALPAISLVNQPALNTAYANDVDPKMIFGQQVYAYGEKGKDVLIAMSTSGNSENIINAIKVANSVGVCSIGITGCAGGKMADICDACIKIPEKETFKVQELTLPVYHAICAMLEETFF